jgi:hypothetical protein
LLNALERKRSPLLLSKRSGVVVEWVTRELLSESSLSESPEPRRAEPDGLLLSVGVASLLLLLLSGVK